MHHFFVQLSGYDISICFSEILDSYVDFFFPGRLDKQIYSAFTFRWQVMPKQLFEKIMY